MSSLPIPPGTNGPSHGKLEKRAVSAAPERPSLDNSLKKPVRRLSSSSSSSHLQKSLKAPPTSPHGSSNPSGTVYSFAPQIVPFHHKFEPNISFPHCLSFSPSTSRAAAPDLESIVKKEAEPEGPPPLIRTKAMYELSIKTMAEVDTDSDIESASSSSGDNMERSCTPLENRIQEFGLMHFEDDWNEMQPGSATKIEENSATESEKLEDL
jgi:hypothetical protein